MSIKRQAGEAPLREWAQDWGFTGAPSADDPRDWLLVVARRTAAAIRRHPGFREQWILVAAGFEPTFPAIAHWNPLLEIEGDFRARVEAHVAECKAICEAAGLQKVSEKPQADRHFKWLALFQVKRLEFRDIRVGETDRIDETSIGKAVRETALQAGVRLRAARRGRPAPIIQTSK